MCSKCDGKGFNSHEEVRKTVGQPSITYIVYEFCDCERGKRLPELWKKYPAWKGAPYKFFEEV